MAFKALYHGDGEHFIPGVPQRHLTDEEYAALDGEARARADRDPMYRVRADTPSPEPVEAAPARTVRSADGK